MMWVRVNTGLLSVCWCISCLSISHLQYHWMKKKLIQRKNLSLIWPKQHINNRINYVCLWHDERLHTAARMTRPVLLIQALSDNTRVASSAVYKHEMCSSVSDCPSSHVLEPNRLLYTASVKMKSHLYSKWSMVLSCNKPPPASPRTVLYSTYFEFHVPPVLLKPVTEIRREPYSNRLLFPNKTHQNRTSEPHYIVHLKRNVCIKIVIKMMSGWAIFYNKIDTRFPFY